MLRGSVAWPSILYHVDQTEDTSTDNTGSCCSSHLTIAVQWESPFNEQQQQYLRISLTKYLLTASHICKVGGFSAPKKGATDSSPSLQYQM